MFAALGDRTRLALVARLSAEGPLSTVRLQAGMRMTRQALAKHLGALERVGLVRGRRGRPRYWELERGRLAAARRWLDEISAQWDDALARLKVFVEK